MSIEEEFLKHLLDDLKSNKLVLPTLPEVALRVRDAVSDDNASAEQIAKVIATDAALSARLIRVVNSPLYRGRAPIEDLKQAVARLGSKTVRSLVTGLVMQQIFQATNDALDARLRAVWEHSMQVAAIARVIAGQARPLKPEEAMLAGLIHDIGVLPVLARAEDTPELLADEALLDRVIESLHCQVGEAILKAWDFPAALVAVAGEHENLQRDPGGAPDYVDIVIVANLESYLGTNHPKAGTDWKAVPAFRRLGLPTEVNEVDMETHVTETIELRQLMTRRSAPPDQASPDPGRRPWSTSS